MNYSSIESGHYSDFIFCKENHSNNFFKEIIDQFDVDYKTDFISINLFKEKKSELNFTISSSDAYEAYWFSYALKINKNEYFEVLYFLIKNPKSLNKSIKVESFIPYSISFGDTKNYSQETIIKILRDCHYLTLHTYETENISDIFSFNFLDQKMKEFLLFNKESLFDAAINSGKILKSTKETKIKNLFFGK